MQQRPTDRHLYESSQPRIPTPTHTHNTPNHKFSSTQPARKNQKKKKKAKEEPEPEPSWHNKGLCNLQSPNTPPTTNFSKLLARGKNKKNQNQNQNKTKKNPTSKQNPHAQIKHPHLLTSMMMKMMI